MAKYNVWVDPAAAAAAAQQRAIADQIAGLSNSLNTSSRLTQIGNEELEKLAGGRVGDSMFGSALRSDAARRKKTLDASYGMAQRARQVAGTGVNQDLVYRRMLDSQKSGIDDAVSDRIAENLPSWMGAAGDMSQTDSQLAAQKASMLSGAAGAYGNAYATQAAGTRVEKKKGFWDKFKGVFGDVVGMAGGLAALSDEQVKNIEGEIDPQESLNIIRQLGAKSFSYRPEVDPQQKPQVGQIAQEVEAVEPRAVEERADGLKEVDFKPLISHTINAVGAIANRQDALEASLQQLASLLRGQPQQPQTML